MRWLTRDMWKVGMALVGVLFLLVLLAWIPESAVGAHETGQPGQVGVVAAVTATVQATPTEDATITALNKEKLTQDVDQQQHTPGNWFWNNGAALISSLILAIAGAFTLFRYLRDQRSEREKQREDRQAERERRDEEQKRWLEDRQAEREKRDEEQQRWLKDQEAEREKRAEERFQTVVGGLSSEREEAKVGAAITLRTFLHLERPGYSQFYRQVFDLAVAHLRLPRTSTLSEDQNTSFPLTTLSQALIAIFKESFPRARDTMSSDPQGAMQSLDASGIQIDNAFLVKADLKRVWMQQALLRNALLTGADLSGAFLMGTNFIRANLIGANLSGTNLCWADLSGVNLNEGNLSGADLSGAKFIGTNLTKADLSRATLITTDLSGASLSGASLSGATLMGANFTRADLSGVDFSGAILIGALLFSVRGLTKDQLEDCKAKRAIVSDEDGPGSSSQPADSISLQSQSNGAQSPPATPSQEGPPSPIDNEKN